MHRLCCHDSDSLVIADGQGSTGCAELDIHRGIRVGSTSSVRLAAALAVRAKPHRPPVRRSSGTESTPWWEPGNAVLDANRASVPSVKRLQLVDLLRSRNSTQAANIYSHELRGCSTALNCGSASWRPVHDSVFCVRLPGVTSPLPDERFRLPEPMSGLMALSGWLSCLETERESWRLHYDCSCCLCKRAGFHPGDS